MSDVALVSSVVDRIAADALERERVAGLAVAVRLCDEVAVARAFGYADVREGVLASEHTRYAIGSITKQFTAAAVLQLCERGGCRLDSPAAEYIIPPAQLPPGATVRHLLSHTSGIAPDVDLAMLVGPTDLPVISPGEGRHQHDALEPGTEWRYSSYGYFLLGRIIEAVTRMRYAEYVTNCLLEPLGLRDSCFGHPGSGAAVGYGWNGESFAEVDVPDAAQTFAAGAMWSTVVDLVKWEQLLRRGSVVGEPSYRAMTTATRLRDGMVPDYGLGFFIGSCGDHRELSHDGSSGGFSAQLAHYRDDDLTVVVLANTEAHVAERIEKRVTRAILGIPEPELRTLSGVAVDLSPYPGTYVYRGQEIPVSRFGNKLTIRTPARKDATLLHQVGDTFVQEDDPGLTFEFIVNAGHTDAVRIRREGKGLAVLRRAV